MAIEVIPKRKIKTKKLLNLGFYASLILFFAFVVSYFVFDKLAIPNREKELAGVKERISQKGTPKEKEMERAVLKYETETKDYSVLLASHKHSSKFFSFFESLCHPQVWVTSIGLNMEESTVTFFGLTENFQTLGQQLIIFKKEKLIKEVNLTNISMEPDGEVSFTMELSLEPGIFQ